MKRSNSRGPAVSFWSVGWLIPMFGLIIFAWSFNEVCYIYWHKLERFLFDFRTMTNFLPHGT